MPYTSTSWGELKTSLLQRLGDSGGVFWLADEAGVYLTEGLRLWAAAARYWRERVTFNTVAGQAFYLLPTVAPTELAMTATDRETFKAIQYSLLESVASQTGTWAPTDMYNLSTVVGAMNEVRNQYLTETGVVLTRSTQAMPAPPIGRVDLDDHTIDVRRAAWIRASDSTHRVLWREDEWSEAAFNALYESDPTIPYAYMTATTAPVQLQVAPPPSEPGTLELITVLSGATLDPAAADTSLGLPDNVAACVKWGALADLVKGDGQQTDPVRTLAAERRWEEFVAIGKMQSPVANALVQGIAMLPVSLFDLDAAYGSWQDTQGQPTAFAVAGWNIIALHPVPDAIYGVELDVVRNAPIPTLDADMVQLGLEDINTIVDYAEYCALFKIGGDDLQRSEARIKSFYEGAAQYNAKLRADALFADTIFNSARREPDERPRRQEVEK